MQVTVKLFASFRQGRFNVAVQEYGAGARVSDVINSLAIPPGEIGMIMVNGRHAVADDQLEHGVQLSLFPLLGGG